MPAKIDTEMFAPCGINCMVCYKHCSMKRAQQTCGGCLAESKDQPLHCRTCKIKDCVKSKDLTYCYECHTFPCNLIKNLEKSYNKCYDESLIENSKIVKEKGIAYFMAAQVQKYSCSECGGIICLHDKECTECGKKASK